MHQKPRILFVDDEKRVLNSMRGLFRRDYDLFLTCEGAEAVEIAAENDVDVIVADQRMPGMTGVEVLAKVKERSPRTVRVLLTGYADPSAVEGSINIGEVFRFLSKPCPPKVLRETLSMAISASRTAPAAEQPPGEPVAKAEPAAAKPAAPEPASTEQPVAEPAPPPAPPPPASAAPADAAQSETSPAPEPAAVADETPPPDVIDDDEDTQRNLVPLKEEDVAAMSERTSSHWQTVTSVVMSEDSVEESQEVMGLGSAMLKTADVGVVVFTIDPEFATTTIRAVSTERNTILATKLSKVAEALEDGDAGVLVTDYKTNNAILKKIIAALKQRLPQLVTIVVSDGRDTTDMISLINFGQVYRYVLKPVEPEKLREEINSAVMHHLYLMSSPESAKRHQVASGPAESEGSSTTVNRFIDRIKNLPAPGKDPADTIS
ncbi:MAG: response regulator [Woeseiaceae bacterium]|nr:response regulator [Woeseiaceae bacterium]